MDRKKVSPLRLLSLSVSGSLLVAMVACGGGQPSLDESTNPSAIPTVRAQSAESKSSETEVPVELSVVGKAAQLNAESLKEADRLATLDRSVEMARKNGVLAKAFVGVPVHRFYNAQTAAHFYTISEEERARVAATLPHFRYEGIAFSVSASSDPLLSPVYRFFNRVTGVHFYSISAEEKSYIEQNLPQFRYEGIAYYASQMSGQGLMPLYRFYQTQRGFHFYSASYTERDNVVDSLPVYHYEGLGYYVLAGATPIEPVGPLNDTGTVGMQCYQAGSSILVSCDSAGARALNHQQDGMIGRDRNAPEVGDGAKGFSYTKISNAGVDLSPTAALGSGPNDWACTRDNVTGLVWEVKTSDGGLRDQDQSFTNYTRSDVPQVQAYQYDPFGIIYRNPTELELTRSSNTLGYRAAVNQLGLCGHSDWRLPTATELMGLVDYGQLQGSFSIDTTWFPDAASSMSGAVGVGRMWWTSEDMHHVPAEWQGDTYHYPSPYIHGWAVDFQNGSVFDAHRGQIPAGVRLVRGAGPSGPRYSFSANGAEVIDHHTRLTWRRCLEGMSWNGSSCVGTARIFRHEAALAHARAQTGWRVPNVKELATIQDRTQPRGYDEAVFPNTPDYGKSWTSTPVMKLRLNGEPVQQPGYGAWIVKFKWGGVVHYDSDGRNSSMLRLVRRTP
jgi:hypothetical protein